MQLPGTAASARTPLRRLVISPANWREVGGFAAAVVALLGLAYVTYISPTRMMSGSWRSTSVVDVHVYRSKSDSTFDPATSDTEGTLMIALSRGSGGGTAMCEGWLFIPGETSAPGKLYYRAVEANGEISAGLVGVNTTNPNGWILMIDRASQLSTGGEPSVQVLAPFAKSPTSIDLRLEAETMDGKNAVKLETSVTPLLQNFEQAGGCFK